jgi:hypothetical protein
MLAIKKRIELMRLFVNGLRLRERERSSDSTIQFFTKKQLNWSKLEFHVLSLPEYLKTSSNFSNFDFEVVF